ncbi:hypothetical protein D3C72_1372980 [compost metagenome]
MRDIRGQAGRSRNAALRAHDDGHASLLRGGDVVDGAQACLAHLGDALERTARQAELAHLARAHIGEIDMPAHQRGLGLGGALERDAVRLHPGNPLQLFQCQVAIGAHAAMTEGERARLLLQRLHHAAQVGVLAVLPCDQHRGVIDQPRDQAHVLGLVLRFLVHRQEDKTRHIDDADGVAVGFGAGDVGHRQFAGGTGLVGDDDAGVGAEAPGHKRRQDAGHLVGAAAGGKSHHQLDRAVIGPGGEGRAARQHGEGKRQSAQEGHMNRLSPPGCNF